MKGLRKVIFLCLFTWSLTALGQSDSTFKSIFKRLEISGIDQNLSREISTDFESNNVVFTLDSSQFSSFFYRLKPYYGDDSSWVAVTGNEFKILNLNPGKYTLEYFIESSTGFVTAKSEVEIIVNKPWWRTWWFWSACFVTLFGVFYSRERFLKLARDEEERQQKRITELELRTLQLQMNPHFIFNSLNSIQSFVMTNETLVANDYLSKFANLIRLFLDSSRSRYISISEEISLLRLYCEMEQLRFDNTFDFEITVDPEVDKSFEIPTMILQPFVENAINHGLRYKENKGFLNISIHQTDEYVIARVKDNGVGLKRGQEIRKKIKKGYDSQGLKITAERLDTYDRINSKPIEYSITNLYTEEETEDVGTVVEVKFPNMI